MWLQIEFRQAIAYIVCANMTDMDQSVKNNFLVMLKEEKLGATYVDWIGAEISGRIFFFLLLPSVKKPGFLVTLDSG
jgi:hypothetical protein